MGRLYLAAALLLAAAVACPAAAPVVAGKTTAAGVPVNVVTVDLNDAGVRVTAGVASGYPFASESFRAFIERAQPAAAINGTFFGKSNLSPVGDLVIGGRVLHVGRLGTPIAVQGGRSISFPSLRVGRDKAWEGYSSVVCAGPRLLCGGRYVLNAWAEGFRDRRLLGRAPRAAIGLTSHNKLLLATVSRSISLWQLARVMRALGAVEAVNLDGGSSCGLYCQGRTITRPGRGLTNFIAVYTRPEAYEMARSQLVPFGFLEGRLAPAAPDWVGKAMAAVGSIQIVEPRQGEVLTGWAPVTMRPGDKNIEYAVLSLDGATRCITNTLPYTYHLDSSSVPDGEHTLSVVGFTGDGSPGPTSEVRVRVANALQQASGTR